MFLEQGYVSLFPGAARDNENATDLIIAEESAKKAKKNVTAIRQQFFFLKVYSLQSRSGKITIQRLKKQKDKKRGNLNLRNKSLKLI